MKKYLVATAVIALLVGAAAGMAQQEREKQPSLSSIQIQRIFRVSDNSVPFVEPYTAAHPSDGQPSTASDGQLALVGGTIYVSPADSLGTCVRGRDAMRQGWASYFKLMRNYRVEVTRTLCKGNAVVLLGFASGNCAVKGRRSKQRWRIPAAWYAEVRGGLVAKWQVYADNKPVYDILADMERR